MAKGSDAIETIISILVMIFFVARGFLKVKPQEKSPTPATPPQNIQRKLKQKKQQLRQKFPLQPKEVQTNVPKTVLRETLKGQLKDIERKTGGTIGKTSMLSQTIQLQRKKGSDAGARLGGLSSSLIQPAPVITAKEESKVKETKKQPAIFSFEQFLDNNELRKAIIMSEILQKPLARRRGLGVRN